MPFEQPTIRPPSEWRSGLIRVTRGCNWNRCRFCGIYPHLAEPGFSIRPLTDIFHDIDFLSLRRPETEAIFLGDADPLQAGPATLIAIANYLYKVFPLQRLTCYARASTLKKIGRATIAELAAAGLNRIHLGLESGNDEILRYQRKGQSAKMVREVAGWLREVGVELSVYVLLGLGGERLWQNHILATAELLNDITPEFIRLRRLWLFPPSFSGPGCPLLDEAASGRFMPQTAEGTVLELQLLLQNLKAEGSFLTCDHENNYIKIEGMLQADLKRMNDQVGAFLAQPTEVKEAHYLEIDARI
ncbi:MAG: radical SAM protein [Desulfoprunum sp.]|nr:radical SAM protein [Desulfoprunum sp.]